VLTLFNGSKRVAAPRRAPVQEPAQESAQRNPKRPDTAP
jgi:MarR family transcriptional regulator for hemolysin